jgi:two-component system response regulator AtoC
VKNLIAKSESMREVLRIADKVAATDAGVLITGESGTGKNILADHIHAKSKRAKKEAVKIDCAALPRELIEAELFGYEKGAFTGAAAAKTGRIESANGSTLLLDEIALFPFDAQAKLLRVLEQREFERLGGNKVHQIDVRVIAMTNVDLKNAIVHKTFREDLYFRLNVVQIKIPALRDRREDILPLAENLLRGFAVKHSIENAELTAAAQKALNNYDFPGNIRELANLLERGLILSANGRIGPEDFPVNLRNPTAAAGKKWPSLENIEERHIHETLKFTKGNKSKAAELLGISRKNLYEKLAKFSA